MAFISNLREDIENIRTFFLYLKLSERGSLRKHAKTCNIERSILCTFVPGLD